MAGLHDEAFVALSKRAHELPRGGRQKAPVIGSAAAALPQTWRKQRSAHAEATRRRTPEARTRQPPTCSPPEGRAPSAAPTVITTGQRLQLPVKKTNRKNRIDAPDGWTTAIVSDHLNRLCQLRCHLPPLFMERRRMERAVGCPLLLPLSSHLAPTRSSFLFLH